MSNFNKYELRTIEIGEDTFDLLLWRKKSGAYTYPAIREDWYTFERTFYYVLKPGEKEKIQLEWNKAVALEIEFVDGGYVQFGEYEGEAGLKRAIAGYIVKGGKKLAGKLWIGLFVVSIDGEQAGRFLIVPRSAKADDAMFLGDDVTPNTRYKIAITEFLKDEVSTFDTYYFETDVSSFNNLFGRFAKMPAG